MAKSDDKVELDGIVTQTYPRGVFLIELRTEGFEGHQLRARLSGKMRMHYIKIVPGDSVRVQVSAADQNLDQGLITFRKPIQRNRP